MPDLSRDETKEIIKTAVINSIVTFARNQLNNRRNFQILDLIIPNERKIRSIVGGMETSLGTTLWEPLAKAVASHNGFEIVNEKLLAPRTMPATLANTIQAILEDRLANAGGYDASSSRNEIIRVCQRFLRDPIDSFVDPPRGHGVDIRLRKDGVDYVYDTKTVQPNISALRGCLTQVLNWYGYYYSRYPSGNIQARIVFPYNPYNTDFWTRIIGGGAPLERDNEALVENQFWDFISGHDNTYELITTAFTEIADSNVLNAEFRRLFNNE